MIACCATKPAEILYHFVLIDFLCRPVAGKAQAADDADEVRWFTPAEAGELGLPKDTAEVVRLGFQKSQLA